MQTESRPRNNDPRYFNNRPFDEGGYEDYDFGGGYEEPAEQQFGMDAMEEKNPSSNLDLYKQDGNQTPRWKDYGYDRSNLKIDRSQLYRPGGERVNYNRSPYGKSGSAR